MLADRGVGGQAPSFACVIKRAFHCCRFHAAPPRHTTPPTLPAGLLPDEMDSDEHTRCKKNGRGQRNQKCVLPLRESERSDRLVPIRNHLKCTGTSLLSRLSWSVPRGWKGSGEWGPKLEAGATRGPAGGGRGETFRRRLPFKRYRTVAPYSSIKGSERLFDYGARRFPSPSSISTAPATPPPSPSRSFPLGYLQMTLCVALMVTLRRRDRLPPALAEGQEKQNVEERKTRGKIKSAPPIYSCICLFSKERPGSALLCDYHQGLSNENKGVEWGREKLAAKCKGFGAGGVGKGRGGPEAWNMLRCM